MKLKDILKELIKVNLYPGKMGADVHLNKSDYKKYPTVDIPINKIVRNEPMSKMNTKEAQLNILNLMALLRTRQKLDPILVTREGGSYKVLDGHHRLTAYQRLGVSKVPAIVVPEKDIQRVDKNGKPI